MTAMILTTCLVTSLAWVSGDQTNDWNNSAARVAGSPPVTVVLKERFPQEHIIAVVRRLPGPNNPDVIAIRTSAASPELLAMALAAVTKARQVEGVVAVRRSFFVIPQGLRYPKLAPADRARLLDALKRLLAAEPQAVPGVGRVRAITLQPTE